MVSGCFSAGREDMEKHFDDDEVRALFETLAPRQTV